MAHLNLTDELFVGKEELLGLQQFANTDTKKIFGFLTKTYGLVGNSDLLNPINNSFLVSNAGTLQIKINNPSYAFAYPNNLITWDKNENFIISDSLLGKIGWVKVSYSENYIEKGTLILGSDGQIIGQNTEFLSRLRGEPNFASKITLFTYSSGVFTPMPQDYIVESVTNDVNAKIYSYTGIGATGTYYYAVTGTFTEGMILLEDTKYPFRYDGCKVEIIEETSTNVPPDEETMKNSNTSFYIARLIISAIGDISIEDKRYVFESDGAKYSKWWSLK